MPKQLGTVFFRFFCFRCLFFRSLFFRSLFFRFWFPFFWFPFVCLRLLVYVLCYFCLFFGGKQEPGVGGWDVYRFFFLAVKRFYVLGGRGGVGKRT